MRPGKPRDAGKEQQWRRWVARWRASGLSVPAFCARLRLSPASFYAWRRELERRDAEQPAFVPVHVVGEVPFAGSARLEILLRGGRTVRVAAGFDVETLRRVVAVLEDGQPC